MPGKQINIALLEKNPKIPQIKVYKRRWLILLIFILYSAANSFQWMEYCVINNVVMKYYNVSAVQVDWTSIIYMIVYPFLVVPASYIIDKKGLRVAALIGGIGTALAAAIKLFSINKNLFYVVLIGQGIGSAAQVFVLCLPNKIAAVWFAPNEASTTVGLAMVGTQLGFALGFLVPPSIVKNDDNLNRIGANLNFLCWCLTIFMIPVTILIIFFFQKQPPLPPSILQYEHRKKDEITLKLFLKQFRRFFFKAFLIYIWPYGINVAVFASVGTLLNQFVLDHFPNSEKDVGWMGLTMILFGIAGSIIFGLILDKIHKYKEVSVLVYLFSSVGLFILMYAFQAKGKLLVYIGMAIFGFFCIAFVPVGFEFAVEMTYPLDEGTTTGILNAMTQGLGVILTIIFGKTNILIGPYWTLALQAGLLLLGTILTAIVPNKLRRQNALKEKG